MKSRVRQIVILASLLYSRAAQAYSTSLQLDHTWENHQQCIDMNGSGSFRPDMESSLIITFEEGHVGVASVVVFELGDEYLGGIRRPGTNEVSRLFYVSSFTVVANPNLPVIPFRKKSCVQRRMLSAACAISLS